MQVAAFYAHATKFDKALEYYFGVLKLAETHPDPTARVNAFSTVANFYGYQLLDFNNAFCKTFALATPM